MVETINKLTKVTRELSQELGRDPKDAEIAKVMGEGFNAEKIRKIRLINIDPVSLDHPVGEEDDSHLSDFVEDKKIINPAAYTNKKELETTMSKLINETLGPREKEVIFRRYGISPQNEPVKQQTLEEIGQEFGVTRERIRQIESKALRKLKIPKIKKQLENFKTDE
jgi:RNA polymerase primary sigma factor